MGGHEALVGRAPPAHVLDVEQALDEPGARRRPKPTPYTVTLQQKQARSGQRQGHRTRAVGGVERVHLPAAGSWVVAADELENLSALVAHHHVDLVHYPTLRDYHVPELADVPHTEV